MVRFTVVDQREIHEKTFPIGRTSRREVSKCVNVNANRRPVAALGATQKSISDSPLAVSTATEWTCTHNLLTTTPLAKPNTTNVLPEDARARFQAGFARLVTVVGIWKHLREGPHQAGACNYGEYRSWSRHTLSRKACYNAAVAWRENYCSHLVTAAGCVAQRSFISPLPACIR